MMHRQYGTFFIFIGSQTKSNIFCWYFYWPRYLYYLTVSRNYISFTKTNGSMLFFFLQFVVPAAIKIVLQPSAISWKNNLLPNGSASQKRRSANQWFSQFNCSMKRTAYGHTGRSLTIAHCRPRATRTLEFINQCAIFESNNKTYLYIQSRLLCRKEWHVSPTLIFL